MLEIRTFAKKHKQKPLIRLLLWLRLWLLKKELQVKTSFPSIAGYYKKPQGFETQKKVWEDALRQSSGFKQNLRWGNLGNPHDQENMYIRIAEKMQHCFNSESTVLELGSWDGAWTKYLANAKKVICVDMYDLSRKKIMERYDNALNIVFYRTKGYELSGIASDSVDFIFSIDSLMRLQKKYYEMYFKEFSRVCRGGGKMYVHLPCTCKLMSLQLRMTPLTLRYINRMCKRYFKHYTILKEDIWHGVMIEATK